MSPEFSLFGLHSHNIIINGIQQTIMSQKADIKILVVDDDPLSALMVSEYLRQSGYQVYKTHSGQEALTLLKKQPIDILLTDIMMPKMSGNELTRQVLKLYPDIIAIAITAMNSTHNAVEFMKNGGMDYIQKPFNTDSLVIAIENATKRLQLNRQLKWTNQELIKRNKALAKEIQKRLEIQQSLENSRDNLKSVFDSMNDFVFILDTHGCVLHVNPVVCYQLGFSQKELFGMNILELHAPQKAQDIAHFVNDMLSYTPTLLIGYLLKKMASPLMLKPKSTMASGMVRMH
ncbi:MAG: response regulator receiver modulated PAS/PAC sensor protein [Candidatus Magnetoglobus multicellularis str. Araruama]|uniref:Response regulator receiver modulated PAS/PAC sensor protein n=1 Tax=Candidatus Magnetoglobus multicellularis str. Araruama TaxID=890399 RepID=A0A1V1P5H3_9BACT|nr:MAG: response regulator receiver modulated PAS/PAC sensor protein [Candidatus Magnetoglobus multicellularis str. Araruama]